jgi:hypothetical protein
LIHGLTHLRHVGDRHLDGEHEPLGLAGVHEGDGARCGGGPFGELGVDGGVRAGRIAPRRAPRRGRAGSWPPGSARFVEIALRRRQADALQRPIGQPIEAFERQRHVCAPLGGDERVISSTITVSTDCRRSRAFDVSRRNSDSGVVMRMSAGSRWNRARSPAGVSPVRIDIAGTRNATPCAVATWAMPASGARRLRSTSTASALSGDRYSTRHLLSRGGSASNISRSRHQRNAVSVLPVPVGASISVESPRAIAGQPCRWGLVGASNAPLNHAATGG